MSLTRCLSRNIQLATYGLLAPLRSLINVQPQVGRNDECGCCRWVFFSWPAEPCRRRQVCDDINDVVVQRLGGQEQGVCIMLEGYGEG
jgi:hypothetical protein